MGEIVQHPVTTLPRKATVCSRPSVAALIAAPTMNLTDPNTGEFAGTVERGWIPPRSLTSRQRQSVAEELAEIREACRPGTPEQIAVRVTATLAHYFVPRREPELWDMILADWSRSLSDMPWTAVQKAFEWCVDNRGRREGAPAPGDVRGRAREMCEPLLVARWRLERLLELPVSDGGGDAA